MLYPYDSLEYNIIYYALCYLAEEWEKDEEKATVQKIAKIHGVSELEVHQALEKLYTDNPDPDALCDQAETDNQ